MVGGAFGGSFGVVDPGGRDVLGQLTVDCDVVDAHPEVAAVADAVVPPGEPAGAGAPHGSVDVDEPDVVEVGEGGPFRRRDVGRPDERVGVEDVTVGRGDVDVAGDDGVAGGSPTLGPVR